MSYSEIKVDTRDIQLKDPLNPQLFSDVAERAANACTRRRSEVNKSSQLRRFYDELVYLNNKVQRSENKSEEYKRVAPYVQMLRAKAAYAKGRKLIDVEFYERFNVLIQQVDSEKTLERAKLFFEAFLGFKKAIEDIKK